MDDVIFEQSFNRCQTQVMPAIITEDFEFYHDMAGVQDRAQFLAAIQKNLCSRENDKLIRKLVPGSLQVYPLKNNGQLYGAIQRGEHEFYIRQADGKTHIDGIAKFTHLWILQGEDWKLKRVLSFDHQPASKSEAE